MQSKTTKVKRIGRKRKEAKMNVAGEVQVRKVELPRLNAKVEGEKKQKVENKKDICP